MIRAALFALLFLGAASVEAQVAGAPTSQTGSPLLARRISIHVRDVSLRDALDRIALLAGFRLSYSGDNIPLDRRVSLSLDTASVATAFDDVLRGYPVQAVVAGDDHVVLAPREMPPQSDSLSHAVAMLDRVVVTGSVIAASERPLPVALDVIPGRDIERRSESELSTVLSGAVPGVWMWEQAPSSMLARYGSIRGASSFGLSYPKIYVDGIEVANPLLFTQISPEIVERVEVIRGPQGAALYGSDAISGVVNMVSRHDGTRADGSHALLRSAAGFTTAFQTGAVATQEHALTIRGGSNLKSGGVTVGGGTTGDYIPDAFSRDIRMLADARVIGSRSTLTANARFSGKRAGIPASPLLTTLRRAVTDSEPQALTTFGLGSSLNYVASDWVTYSLTGGFDGYNLSNLWIDQSAVPAAVDTTLRASGSALRGSLRASGVARFGAPEQIGATVTLAVEHSALSEHNRKSEPVELIPVLREPATLSSSNTGITVQGNLTFRDALYVSTGIRHESITQTTGLTQGVTLPLLGAAYVVDGRLATLKLRAAYGKGVRAPRATSGIGAQLPSNTHFNPFLEPEEQSGIEAGVDLIFGGRFGLHLTRFDQTASGLIQTVTIQDPRSGGGGSGGGGSGGPGGPGRTEVWYQLQNVGNVTNRGWESQASFTQGDFAFAGAATLVDSRVQRLAKGYSGDLMVGDRMLSVPARTVSGTIGWQHGGAQLSSTIARASDWIYYDRLRIAQKLIATNHDAREVTGRNLRQFQVSYPGATRLRSAGSLDVWRGMSLTFTGENLLNRQRGEPDTITIVPGRTVTLGIRAKF
jgi:outer membrane receptor protein involved in Fe transport